ncbi:MAG: nucleoside hydrolase [Actinomycetota bacterium]
MTSGDPTTTRTSIVLDCDPGLDDAVAIALALRHCDVAGITTVGGNVGIEMTTANALAVTDLLGRSEVEVHAGHDRPFGGLATERAADVHGPNGMGDTELPAPTRPATSSDAVRFLLDRSRATDGLWLVATGPLTNIAHAVTADPTLVDRVAGVSWMGGSTTYGNATAAAEFNAWADPEAADVVLGAGFRRVLMHGLGVTHSVLLDEAWIDGLASTGGTVATTYADILRYYLHSQTAVSVLDGAAVHDALAVLHVSHPDLFAGVDRAVTVVRHGEARGMTLVDTRPMREPPAPNVEVVERADADAIRALIAEALAI